MILPTDAAPDKSIYVMGAGILDILKLEPHQNVDPKNLYDTYIQRNAHVELSYNYFLYALDWLYLIGSIDVTSKMKITRCF